MPTRWQSVCAAALLASPSFAQFPLTLVSLGDHGQQGNDHSESGTMSPNGRYVVFTSAATNLVPGDTNGVNDIFLRDLHANTLQRVSVGSMGEQSNWDTYQCVVASTGVVAFASYANTLVPGDNANQVDVFLHDPVTGETRRISFGWNGTEANGYSYDASISADGKRVAFRSEASNLVPGDTNHADDIFVYDDTTASTSRVSVSTSGAQSIGIADLPCISANGRFVAFLSGGSDLVPGDTNAVTDVFVRDLELGTTERVSVATDGTQTNGACDSPCFISSDGRYVVFGSSGTNLAPGDSNNVDDVFVRDRFLGTTVRASVGNGGLQALGTSGNGTISRDGRVALFVSYAANLAPHDINGFQPDVFAHMFDGDKTLGVSVFPNGDTGIYSSFSYVGCLSEDGAFAMFDSDTAFVPSDINLRDDVYLADLRVPTGTPMCFGDGSGTPCPCGNAGAIGHGCENSAGLGGGLLEAWGTTQISADALSLRASRLPANAPTLFFQGTQSVNGGAGAVLGDGLRCAGGTIKRMGTHHALGGVVLYGYVVGDPRISVTGSVMAGSTYEYQAWFRDTAPYCTSATSNLTNAVEVTWQP
jgi:Tol biopolymer transport system component